jgi:hypothetical protein
MTDTTPTEPTVAEIKELLVRLSSRDQEYWFAIDKAPDACKDVDKLVKYVEAKMVQAESDRFYEGLGVDKPAPTHGETHQLDVDHFEKVRSLHRVVRALHDGECPQCHRIQPSEAVRIDDLELPGGYGNRCTHCNFTISAAEMDAVAAEFAPVMQKNFEHFLAWRKARQPPQHVIEIRFGDVWATDNEVRTVTAVDEHMVWYCTVSQLAAPHRPLRMAIPKDAESLDDFRNWLATSAAKNVFRLP